MRTVHVFTKRGCSSEASFMRFGIISDIHGNLVALEAVLQALSDENIDRLICLGDVVGYGPQPEACLDLIAEHDAITIAGNHEEALCRPEVAARFNDNARIAIEWTRAKLIATRPDLMRVVANLPGMAYFGETIMCVHDTPAPGAPPYLLDGYAAATAFAGVDVPICFVGHTHVPVAFHRTESQLVETFRPENVLECEIDTATQWIINPGAVGQPRDGDVRAASAVLDLDAGRLKWIRVAYDIAEAQHRAESAGLPTSSSRRLAIGA